ncbi:MFS transporter [Micromonospora globbae]|uniref:MFS transporter n=1 Tax=Micromonospora globbae TaxID=1894969 RepID=A0ABZ1SAF4_9ACTN|nr:MFS transporter [Micromonospora globbae]
MTRTPSGPPRHLIVAALVAFAAFGSFWGVWGASVPRVQHQAGIGDGQLGLALLFVGAGALPAMLAAGRALDRWGLRVAAVLVGALGVVGAGLALTAVNLASLCVGLAVVGAVSGAADVAMNAVAGRAEQTARRPVITRAHGVFSSLVVLASLATGVASAASLPLAVPFTAVAVLSLLAGAALLRTLPSGVDRAAEPASGPEHRTGADPAPSDRWRVVPFLLVGVLGALAFATENAHQSWSAVFAHDELGSGPGLSAVAPAVFAGTVAVTRFATGGLKAAHARAVLLAGASAAAAGTALIAVAPTLLVAGVGLAVAAAGTAVLFPTLVGIVSRNVDESHRGRATSVVTTVSYLGFLAGPVYVGLWADAVGLRGALVAVAALAVGLFVLTPALLRLSGLGRRTGVTVDEVAPPVRDRMGQYAP